MADNPMRVFVLDMQPIDPPVGGGRLRILGLYHALGHGLETTYLGTYDWDGEPYRCHRLSPSLTEINIPLALDHFELNHKWSGHAGKNLIDTAFPLTAHASPAFVAGAAAAVRAAAVVVFSHPWVYPLVRDELDDVRQLVVYDAHNVEGLLRTRLLDDGGFGTEIAKHVLATEYELAHRADLLLACSREDCRQFQDLYGVAPEKTHEAPNGVFAGRLVPPTPAQRAAAREALGVRGFAAMFVGSSYPPNVEAVEFLCRVLGPALPQVMFLIVGGVCDSGDLGGVRQTAPANVVFVGPVTEDAKTRCLWAADLALNPMFSGSGTNIKMFDFMAAGLPVLATPTGARGIDTGAENMLVIAEADGFAAAVGRFLADRELGPRLGWLGRRLVETRHAWETISPSLGRLLREELMRKRAGAAAPLAA